LLSVAIVCGTVATKVAAVFFTLHSQNHEKNSPIIYFIAIFQFFATGTMGCQSAKKFVRFRWKAV
jgi:hypothetical protein